MQRHKANARASARARDTARDTVRVKRDGGGRNNGRGKRTRIR